jgi:hypothetical protein
MFKRVLVCAAAVAVGFATTAPPAQAAGVYAWKPPAKMVDYSHAYQGADAVLADGRLLLTGGGDIPLKTAEVFDPLTSQWSAVAPMHIARHNHVATTLLDGRVLVAGAVSPYSGGGSYELYDPQSGSWTASKPMPITNGKYLVTLPSGKAALLGGLSDSLTYDPATDLWSPLTVPVAAGLVVQFADGRVLVVGAQTYVFDPATSAWLVAPPRPSGLFSQSARLGDDGAMLVDNYRHDGTTPRVVIFDSVSMTWSVGPVPSFMRLTDTRIAAMPDGRVVAIGGRTELLGKTGHTIYPSDTSTGLFDPDTGTWSRQANRLVLSGGNKAVTLPSGVLVYERVLPEYVLFGGLLTLVTDLLKTRTSAVALSEQFIKIAEAPPVPTLP